MKRFKVEFIKFNNGLMTIKDESRRKKVIGCRDIATCGKMGTAENIFCDECPLKDKRVDREDLNIIEVEI